MLLDLYQNKFDPSIYPSRGILPTNPKTIGERFDIELEHWRASEQSISESVALHDAYEREIEKLYRATGKRVTNPMALPEESPEQGLEFFTVGAGGMTRLEAKSALQVALIEGKKNDPTIRSLDEIDADVKEKARLAWERAWKAGEVSDPWTGLGAFAGAAVGAMTDPVNLATLPFGASARLSGSLALRILKAGAAEGAVAAGSQAAIEAATLEFKEAAGIEPSPILNILTAGAAGAVLGGALRGVAESLRLRTARGLGLTLDELDALAVTERYAPDVASTPKGVAVDDHIDALNAAIQALERMDPFIPGGPFSLLRRPFPDVYESALARLSARDAELDARSRLLFPQFTEEKLAEIAGVMARLDTIEARLADPNLTTAERQALRNRRDELLADFMDPAAARAELAKMGARAGIERERANIATEIARIRTERAFDPGFTPGPIARAEKTRIRAREEAARVEAADPVETAASATGEARRIAADLDPVITFQGRQAKASELLQEADEAKRVANEIVNACLTAGKIAL